MVLAMLELPGFGRLGLCRPLISIRVQRAYKRDFTLTGLELGPRRLPYLSAGRLETSSHRPATIVPLANCPVRAASRRGGMTKLASPDQLPLRYGLAAA